MLCRCEQRQWIVSVFRLGLRSAVEACQRTKHQLGLAKAQRSRAQGLAPAATASFDCSLHCFAQENARLRAEVEELNDTMFSKTFKPPSAWAGAGAARVAALDMPRARLICILG